MATQTAPPEAADTPHRPRGIRAAAVLMALSGWSIVVGEIGYAVVLFAGDAHDSRVAGTVFYLFVLFAAAAGGFFAAASGLRKMRRRVWAVWMSALFLAVYAVLFAVETGLWDRRQSPLADAIFSATAAFADMTFAGLRAFGVGVGHDPAEFIAAFFAAAHLAALLYLILPKTKALFITRPVHLPLSPPERGPE
jgi:hypothetical protein